MGALLFLICQDSRKFFERPGPRLSEVISSRNREGA